MPQISIDADELVKLTLAICNIESPAGNEAKVGEFVFDWMRNEGFAPRKIGMFPDRFCVLGMLPGRGDGYSLIFNSHMDAGRSKADRWSIRDPDAAISKEVGTRYLIQHGGVADFALVAEGTDFRYAAIEAGKAFFKITVFGDDQYYTPFVPDAGVDAKHPNAIVRAALLIPALHRSRHAATNNASSTNARTAQSCPKS